MWYQDKMMGDGTYYWADGKKYVGSWMDGMMSGRGTLYDADGSVISAGLWAYGDFVGEESELIEE